MSDTLLANDPAARTETGEIKNLQATEQKTETKTDDKSQVEKKVDEKVEDKVDAKVDPKADDKSLLNKDDKAKPGAPEKYEDFKVPEGYKLDEPQAKELGELFKSLNIDQAGAQKLVDTYIAKQKDALEAPYKAMLKQREDWQTATKSDTEIGNKLPEVRLTISRALDALGDPKLATEFREAIDFIGAGDHPVFIKTLYKLSQLVGEGKVVRGANPSAFGQRSQDAKPATAAQALYPNLPP